MTKIHIHIEQGKVTVHVHGRQVLSSSIEAMQPTDLKECLAPYCDPEHLDLRCLSTGDLIISGAFENVDMTIESDQSVMMPQLFSSHQCSMKANKLMLGGSLLVDTLQLLVHDQLDVLGTVYANDIEISVKTGSMKNTGQLWAERSLTLHRCSQLVNYGDIGSPLVQGQLKRHQNHGMIVANTLNLQGGKGARWRNHGTLQVAGLSLKGIQKLSNFGEIVVRDRSRLKVGALQNHAVIRSSDQLNLEFTGEIINHAGAMIAAQNNLTLQDHHGARLVNDGCLLSEEQVHIFANSAVVINQGEGLISAKKLAMAVTQFSNASTIGAECFDLTVAGSNCINQATGSITSERFTIRGIGQFANAGDITTQETFKALLTSKIKNSGQIHSINKLKMLALKKIQNEALLKAQTLQLHAGEQLFNEYDGVIQAEAVRMRSAGHLSNAGLVRARDVSMDAKDIRLSAFAKVISFDQLRLRAHKQVANQGLVRAQNAAIIESYGSIWNGQHGQIDAKEVMLHAPEILNQGLIEGQQLLLEALARIVQTPEAKLISKQALLLLSHRDMDLSGHLQAEVCAVLQASRQLALSLQSKLGASTIAMQAAHVRLQGRVLAQESIEVAAQTLKQYAESVIKAPIVSLQADVIQTAGQIVADELSLDADEFENGLGAMLLANALSIQAIGLKNQGMLRGNQIDLGCPQILINLAAGDIISTQDLLLVVSDSLINAGRLVAQGAMTIKAGNLLQSLATSQFSAKTMDLTALSIDHAGTIHAKDAVFVECVEMLKTYQGSQISAEHAIQILSERISNRGLIVAGDRCHLSVQASLENYQTGRIAADKALDIISAAILVNHGQLKANKNLNLRTKKLCQNMVTGEIEAGEALEILSEDIVRNQGLIVAKSAYLQAENLLCQEETARLIVEARLNIQAKELRNAGELLANQIDIQCQTRIENCAAGVILAAAKSQLVSEIFENAGAVVAESLSANIAKVIHNWSQGKMMASADLVLLAGEICRNAGRIRGDHVLIKAAETFVNAASGRLDIKESLSITAHSLENQGEIQAMPTLHRQVMVLLRDRQMGDLSDQELMKRLRQLPMDAELLNAGDPVQVMLCGLRRNAVDKTHFVGALNAALATRHQARVNLQGDTVRNSGSIASGTIESLAQQLLENDGDLLADTLHLNAKEALVNGETGRVFAQSRVAVQARTIKQAGKLIAEKALLSAESSIENLLSAMILVGSQCQVDTKRLGNYGLIQAEKLHAKTLQVLNNWDSGTMVATKSLLLIAKETLCNYGRIQSDETAHLEAVEQIENTLSGIIEAKGLLKLLGKGGFRNLGRLNASDPLQIEVEQALINYRSGRIDAKAALALICQNSFINEGEIQSGNDLHLTVRGIVQNAASGHLSATEQLELIAASWVTNQGQIDAVDVTIQANAALKNMSSGKVNAQASLTMLSQTMIENAGELEAQAVYLKAKEKISNTKGARVYAESKLIAQADAIKNAGKLLAKDILLQSHNELENLLSGMIIAASQLQCDAKRMDNQGMLVAEQLFVDCAAVFKNFATGRVTAATDLQLLSNRLLNHAGQITQDQSFFAAAHLLAKSHSSDHFMRESLEWIANSQRCDSFHAVHTILASVHRGEMTEDQAIERLKTTVQLDDPSLSTQIQSILRESIKPKQALLYIAASMVKNAGEIKAENVSIKTQKTLSNLAKGTISAEQALAVLSELAIKNAGQIKAQSVKLAAEQVIDNISHGLIHGNAYLEIDAKKRVRNRSKIQGGKVNVKSKTIRNTGKIHADDDMSLDQYGQGKLVNSGQIEAEKQCDIHFDWLTNTGKIDAKVVLFDLKNILKNHGSIKAQDKIMMLQRAERVINTGDMVAKNLCRLMANRIDAKGMIQADQGIVLDAVDLYLRGKIKAAGDLIILAENNFEYTTANLTAEGLLSLNLKDGSLIRYNINTPGSLKIALQPAVGEVMTLTKHLSAGGDLELDLPGRILINRANLTANDTLGIQADSIKNEAALKARDGFLQAVTGDIHHGKVGWYGEKTPVMGFSGTLQCHAKGKITVNHGEIYANQLRLESDQLEVSDANVATASHAAIKARKGRIGKRGMVQVGGHLAAEIGDLQVGIEENVRDQDVHAYQAQHALSDYVAGATSATTSETFKKTGGVQADSAKLTGQRANITGEVVTQSDLAVEIDDLSIRKRQYHYDQTVTDVHTKKSWWGLKSKTTYTTHTIHCKEAQAGGVFKSLNGRLLAKGNTLRVRGGEFSGRKGVFGEYRDRATYEYIEDVSVGHHSSHGQSGFLGFSSRTSNTHHEVQKITKGSTVSEEAVVNMKVMQGKLDLHGAEIVAKEDVVLFARDGIHFEAAVLDIDMGVQHSGEGWFGIKSTHAKRQELVNNDIASCQGNVFLLSESDIHGTAPTLLAGNNIVIKGADINLQSALVNYSVESDSTTVQGFSVVDEETKVSGQRVARSTFFAGGSQHIEATQGDVRLRAVNLVGGQQENDKIKIKAKNNVTLDGFQTEHQMRQEVEAIGLSFTGSQAIGALMNGDVKQAGMAVAMQLFPAGGAVAQLLSADNNADRLGSAVQAGYLLTKTAQSIQKDGLLGHAKSSFSPSVGISYDKSVTKSRWTESEGTDIHARHVEIEATDGDVTLTQMTLNKTVDSLMVEAGRDIHIGVYADTSGTDQYSYGATVSFGANGWGGDVRGSMANANKTTYGANAYQLKKFGLKAGRSVNMVNTHVSADEASIDAESLSVETMLNEEKSSSIGGSIGTSGVSLSAQKSTQQSASIQSGIHARDALHVKVKKANLKGAAITADDAADAQFEADSLTHEDVVGHQKSDGGGLAVGGFVDASYHGKRGTDHHRATIGANIYVTTQSDLGQLNRDESKAHEECHSRSDYRVVIPTEMLLSDDKKKPSAKEQAEDLESEAGLGTEQIPAVTVANAEPSGDPAQSPSDVNVAGAQFVHVGTMDESGEVLAPKSSPVVNSGRGSTSQCAPEPTSYSAAQADPEPKPKPKITPKPLPPEPNSTPAVKKKNLMAEQKVDMQVNNHDRDRNGRIMRRDDKTGQTSKTLSERVASSDKKLKKGEVGKPKIKWDKGQTFFDKSYTKGELKKKGDVEMGVQYRAQAKSKTIAEVEYSEKAVKGALGVEFKAQQGITLLKCDTKPVESKGTWYRLKNQADCEVVALNLEIDTSAKVALDTQKKQGQIEANMKVSGALLNAMVENETEVCLDIPFTKKEFCVNNKIKTTGFIVGGGVSGRVGFGNYKNKTKLRTQVGAGGGAGWVGGFLDYLDLSVDIKPKASLPPNKPKI